MVEVQCGLCKTPGDPLVQLVGHTEGSTRPSEIPNILPLCFTLHRKEWDKSAT